MGFSLSQHVAIPANAVLDASVPQFLDIEVIQGAPVQHLALDQIFRFPTTAWICAEDEAGVSSWSVNKGRAWSNAVPASGVNPRGPFFGAEKSALAIDGETIMSFARTLTKQTSGGNVSGRYRLTGNRKGTIEWRDVALHEILNIDIPLSIPYNNDAGGPEVGFLKHHGDVSLRDGSWLSQFYGAYAEDAFNVANSYPALFGSIKWRTITMRSMDRFASFVDPRTAAGLYMEARGTADSPGIIANQPAFALTQEGFCEADMDRAPNGDIVAPYRTGGRRSGGSEADWPQIGTPPYLNWSEDDGREWNLPRQMPTYPPRAALSSQNPHILFLPSGLGVVVWSGGSPEGNWIGFTNGVRPYRVQGVTKLGSTSNYMSFVQTEYDEVLVATTVDGVGRCVIPFTVRRAGEGLAPPPALALGSSPGFKVPSGTSALLDWWDRGLQNLRIFGGAFPVGGQAVQSNLAISTGPLTAKTTFRIEGEIAASPNVKLSRTRTIDII